MSLIVAPLLGILGVLVGAVAQYFFLRRTNSEGKLSDRTALAYSDYLGAIALIATHQGGDADVIDEANHQLADAKCRIVLYGEPVVIDAIAAFTRGGNVLNTKEQMDLFVTVVQVMRHSNGSKVRVAAADIVSILFGQ